jgi:hypothetical protein
MEPCKEINEKKKLEKKEEQIRKMKDRETKLLQYEIWGEKTKKFSTDTLSFRTSKFVLEVLGDDKIWEELHGYS